MMSGLTTNAVGLFVGLGFLTPGVTQTDEHGLLRSASVTIEYRALGSTTVRATEEWTLMVHPDAARTLNTRILNREVASRTTIIHRVDAGFNPLDTFIERWVADDYQGIGLFSLRDGRVQGLSRGPAGESSHVLAVPDDVTLISHAIAADAWQVVPKDLEVRKRFEMTAYSIALSAEAAVPFLESILHVPIEWLGYETITVPAGQFDTIHIKLAGRFDLWHFGPDRTLARMIHEELGREYLLTEYEGPR